MLHVKFAVRVWLACVLGVAAYIAAVKAGGKMLQAILSGKAGRIGREDESQRWCDVFHRSEDLRTATFFGRSPYLSDGAVPALLALLLVRQQLDLSEFLALELRPRLRHPLG